MLQSVEIRLQLLAAATPFKNICLYKAVKFLFYLFIYFSNTCLLYVLRIFMAESGFVSSDFPVTLDCHVSY